jgi:hypothetical protein
LKVQWDLESAQTDASLCVLEEKDTTKYRLITKNKEGKQRVKGKDKIEIKESEFQKRKIQDLGNGIYDICYEETLPYNFHLQVYINGSPGPQFKKFEITSIPIKSIQLERIEHGGITPQGLARRESENEIFVSLYESCSISCYDTKTFHKKRQWGKQGKHKGDWLGMNKKINFM